MSAAQRSITDSCHYFGSANVASHVPSHLAWDPDDLLLQFIVLFCVVCVPTDIVFASCATQCFQPEERPNTARMRLIEHDVF